MLIGYLSSINTKSAGNKFYRSDILQYFYEYLWQMQAFFRNCMMVLFCWLILAGCTVTFISGYDPVIDETVSRMKKDFNLHFIRLSRTLQDNDPNNQKIENFLGYYDNMEADLITLADRADFLDNKATIVKKQVRNMDSTMHAFMQLHKAGLPDRPGDDRHDMRDAVNSSMTAVIRLQEALRTSGKMPAP